GWASARCAQPQLERGSGDRFQGPPDRLGGAGGQLSGRGPRARAPGGSRGRSRVRRGAQAHRKLAPDAGMGGGAGAAARQYLDLRSEPRILQRQWRAQSRILVRGAKTWIAAKNLSAARIGGAAHGL